MVMQKVRSLIIVPFDRRSERVVDTARKALAEIGVEVQSFDDLPAGASWAEATIDAIRVSDFVVVDVTRQDPNVFYELGLAHALRKPAILMVMSESGQRLPSALAGFSYLVYDAGDLDSLSRHLKRAASAFVAKEAEVA